MEFKVPKLPISRLNKGSGNKRKLFRMMSKGMASQDIKEGPSISCDNLDDVYGQSSRGIKKVKPVFPVSVSLIIEKEA